MNSNPSSAGKLKTHKPMKRIFVILFLSLLFQACSDGDVIVTTFNFDNVALKTCGDVGNYVFYKENTEVFESLSLRLGTQDSIYKTEGTKTYELSANTNFVNYRSYDGVLGNNYFCSSIPPTSPNVEADYLAVSGTVLVIVTFKYEDPLPKENLGKRTNSEQGLQYRSTIKKDVQIILKNIVLISGDKQIIQETLDMGTIENVRTEEILP